MGPEARPRAQELGRQSALRGGHRGADRAPGEELRVRHGHPAVGRQREVGDCHRASPGVHRGGARHRGRAHGIAGRSQAAHRGVHRTRGRSQRLGGPPERGGGRLPRFAAEDAGRRNLVVAVRDRFGQPVHGPRKALGCSKLMGWWARWALRVLSPRSQSGRRCPRRPALDFRACGELVHVRCSWSSLGIDALAD